MECAHKWKMVNKNYQGFPNQRPYWEIPCGRCVNCMINKTEELKTRCEYEMTKYKHCSFMTLTYDDLCVKINDEGIMTLCYKDVQDMLKRLRIDLKRGKLQESEYLQKDFKYLICGEYGDESNRPHYHALFFGIDFECKKVIEKYWKMGRVDSGHLKSGGIKYVLKYMHKAINNKEFRNVYDENNLERPFQVHSLGLGRGLYEKQKEHIKENGTILWHNKEIPSNRYYANKMLIYNKPYQWQETYYKMNQYGIKKQGELNGRKVYTKKQVEDFRKGNAYSSEIDKIKEMRAKGIPMEQAEKLYL